MCYLYPATQMKIILTVDPADFEDIKSSIMDWYIHHSIGMDGIKIREVRSANGG